jgi:hypothetical protein
MLSQPHPDPRGQELQWQRQRPLRGRRLRRPSYSSLLRAEIPSVKLALACRQAPGIAHFSPVLFFGHDGEAFRRQSEALRQRWRDVGVEARVEYQLATTDLPPSDILRRFLFARQRGRQSTRQG